MNVSFIVNNTTFKTYSFILSSHSSYFKGYFITHPPPATFIVPPGISKETVQFFCQYIENNINQVNNLSKRQFLKDFNESSSTKNLNLISNNIPNYYNNIPQNYFNNSFNMIPSVLVELYSFLNLYEINDLKNKIKNYILSILSNENIWLIQEKAIDLGNDSIIEMCNEYIDRYRLNKKRKTNVYCNYYIFNNNYEQKPFKKISKLDPKGKKN